MIDGFANPLLAFGALLAVVPVVIHLLNRRRHRPLAFGAMRFVVAAHRRTRRRARLESLLLLLLRTLAVAFLAFALARPFVGGDSLLTALGERRRDLVLLVDASASTGYREGLGDSFERIVQRARQLVDDLDESRGDRVRVVLVDDSPRAATNRSKREALALLDSLAAPSPTGADLAGALVLAVQCLDEWGGEEVELRFVTDLQRRTFALDAGAAQGDGDGRGPLAAALDALAERGARLSVEDLGPAEPHPPNAAVVGLALAGPAPAVGAPGRVEVAVRNFGPQALAALRVSLEVEGTRMPVQSVDLAPDETATSAFAVRWQSAGEQRVVARIAADGLVVDDERSLVVEVSPPVNVLLVNGAPSDEAIELDEVGLLAAVLSPPTEGGFALEGDSPFEPRVVVPAELEAGAVDLARVDVVWLANVSQLSTRTVERLTEWVRGGGALVMSLGDGIAPAATNARLFAEDGSGLLPARLLTQRAVADRRREYYRVRAFDERHPALSFFADERFRRLLVEVPVFEYVACAPLPDARVLAELDDGGAPLLVERDFGRGRTYLLTTSIDPAWTRLPQSPKTLVPLTHEWLRHAARRPTSPRNVAVGEPLVLETAGFPRRPAVVPPDGRRRPVDAEPKALPGGRWSLLVSDAADQPGLWTAEGDDGVLGSFAVALDAEEGDLVRFTSAELASVHPALEPLAQEVAEEGGQQTGPTGELWRPLVALVLALLVAESLVSAFVGRRRRSAA